MGTKKIKSTSDLGCTLDTERPWTPVLLPTNTDEIELLLEDGTIIIGWYNDYRNTWMRRFNDGCGQWIGTDNPVVAWREIVTDKTERNG